MDVDNNIIYYWNRMEIFSLEIRLKGIFFPINVNFAFLEIPVLESSLASLAQQ